MALARVPLVWDLLGARRFGREAAILRYAWLWVGLVMADRLIRSRATRLFAYGAVLLGSEAILLFFRSLDVAIVPDLGFYFNMTTAVLAAASWLAAGTIAAVAARSSRAARAAGSA